MPKIQKNKIEQCPKIFIYRDVNGSPHHLNAALSLSEHLAQARRERGTEAFQYVIVKAQKRRKIISDCLELDVNFTEN